MEKTKKLLGQRIKQLRKLKRMTQEQLAEIVEIDPKHLSSIETGRNSPTLLTLEKISDALNIEIKGLFDFQNDDKLRREIHNLIDIIDDEHLNIVNGIIKIIFINKRNNGTVGPH